jgi:hypothetical protein
VQNANNGKRTASANNPKDFANPQAKAGPNAANMQSPVYNVFG